MSGQLHVCALWSGLQSDELFVVISIQVCATLFLHRMVITNTYFRLVDVNTTWVCWFVWPPLWKPKNNWQFCSLKMYNQPAASIIIIILSDYQKLSSNLIISKIPQLVVIWFDWKCSLSPDVTGSLGIIYVLGWFNAPRSNITLWMHSAFTPIPRRRANLWS